MILQYTLYRIKIFIPHVILFGTGIARLGSHPISQEYLHSCILKINQYTCIYIVSIELKTNIEFLGSKYNAIQVRIDGPSFLYTRLLDETLWYNVVLCPSTCGILCFYFHFSVIHQTETCCVASLWIRIDDGYYYRP